MKPFACSLCRILAAVLFVACAAKDARHIDGSTANVDANAAHALDAANISSDAGSLMSAQSGTATWYDATGAGSCLYDPTPNDLRVAAMNVGQFMGSEACGACLQVSGPSGQVTVRVVDQCGGTDICAKVGNLDLSKQAFAMIADTNLGNVPITWQMVKCDVTGNIVYHFKENSSQYWEQIQPRNFRVPVSTLEIQESGAWKTLPREDYDFFTVSPGAGLGPYQMRITSIDGQVIADANIALQNGANSAGSGQFN